MAKQISSDDYITYIALENDTVVGFIGLLKKLNGPYMILDMMQVSSEPLKKKLACANIYFKTNY